VSTPAFEPTNGVEVALVAALGDAGRIPEFPDALSVSRVQVPVTELPDADGQVSFPIFDSQGDAFISVFTPEAALARAGRGEEPHIELTGRDLAIMWPAGANMAINPGAGVDIALPGDHGPAPRPRALRRFR
jgi:hypothetical protein